MADIPATLTTDLVPDAVRTVIRLLAPADPDKVSGDQELIGDLGYHSLALAELGFTLEDMFCLDPVTPEKAMVMSSVDDITALITEALGQGDGRLPEVAEVRAICAQYGAVWDPEQAAAAT
jgi:acyl carrier protein